MSDEKWMKLAIEKGREAIAAGQTPFAAAIVRGQEVIACCHNLVWASTDITAHGEIVTIRQAIRILGNIDLSGCTIYSTTEPCPMCFSACHWAKLDRIVFGASIADAQAAGFNELPISNEQMKLAGGSPIQLTGGVLGQEAAALFTEWRASGRARKY